MPRNGSGVFSPPSANYPAVSGTLIESADRNAIDADIATAITNSIAVNGESVVTNNIPFGGNKLTGVAPATVRTDVMTLANAQDGTGVYVATVGGTADVITISPNPSVPAYVAGQEFSFIAGGANTTNVTLNVSGLGAKAITKNGATALVAGDIPNGFLVTVKYDGTRFQLVGAKDNAFGGGTFTGDITMSASSIIEAEGAAVASASSTNIWATDGNTRHITGTTTINDFGTAPQAGARMKVIFDGVLTLTQGANLNLNGGGSNITTAADDWAEVYADTTTQFDVTVHRKSGVSVVGGAAATTTSSGIVELATDAEVIAGTDTSRAITPSGLFAGLNATGTAPIYACRAWVHFNGTGTPAIVASGNVSSITDNGVGDFTINFTTAMPDANYSVSGTASTIGGGAVVVCPHTNGAAESAPTTSSFRITNRVSSTFAVTDSKYIQLSIFR